MLLATAADAKALDASMGGSFCQAGLQVGLPVGVAVALGEAVGVGEGVPVTMVPLIR